MRSAPKNPHLPESIDNRTVSACHGRREFLRHAAAFTVAAGAGHRAATAAGPHDKQDGEPPHPNRGRIYKSVKWGMIGAGKTVLEKFQVQKELGYDGIEFVSPSNYDLQELIEASRKTGLPIHGVVDMVHWRQRLSSPDPAVRERGRMALEQAIRDTYTLHGNAVLLVPGRVTGPDENHDHVWQRSIVEIRKVLPLAAKLGVRVLIENVWNGFCEDPQQFRDYIDEIASPWVGVYFDIGNVRKFGPSEDWIRTLRHRIVKLDVKDWGKANGFCKIGDGDVNWPEVRKALREIGFTGWCTAEVRGGDHERLAEIAERMNRVLGL